MKLKPQTVRIGVAILVVLGAIAYLAITGVQSNRSYYVTISELDAMGSKAFTRHLRVAGNIEPGSIQRDGTNAQFVLVEQGRTLKVNYQGSEPPPDTFKDNAQALAQGTMGHDGVFHATEVQAKCASKYAPENESTAAEGTASLKTPSATAASTSAANAQPAAAAAGK